MDFQNMPATTDVVVRSASKPDMEPRLHQQQVPVLGGMKLQDLTTVALNKLCQARQVRPA
jgi:hypothetical protein